MSTQDKFTRELTEMFVQYLSHHTGPNFYKIKSIIAKSLSTCINNDDEIRGMIIESFLSIWNLSMEELEMLRDDLSAMFLHCKDTNPELFAEFEANIFNKVKVDSTGCEYNYPCVRLFVDGNRYKLVGGTPLHLYLFYGEVMFDRFGPYTGVIELTHGEFAAIRAKTLFFPQVYIK